MRQFIGAVGIALALLSLVNPAWAANAVVGTGSPASCTEDAFNTALNSVQGSGGGAITFNCGGPATITFTGGKIISAANVIIDGGNQITLSGGNAVRHFYTEAATHLTLKNIILKNGFDNTYGGGSILSLGSLTLESATIRDSNVDPGHSGGAVMSYGPVTITNSLVENNTGGSVGGLFLFGENADATISNSTFRDNRTTSSEYGYGGAITVWDGADVIIQGSTLTQNQAQLGGAVYNQTATSTIDIKQNSTLSQNSATLSGGGIYSYLGTVNLTDVLVTANTSGRYGGGMWLGESTSILTDVTISGNSAAGDEGGGIFLYWSVLILDRVTIDGNTAVNGGGGGLVNFEGTLTATNSTFSNNTAKFGGGVNHSGIDAVTTLSQVAISGNSAGQGGGIYQSQGSMVLSQSTLNDNTAAATDLDLGNGGGIYSIGTTDIVDTTFNSNLAGRDGGGVYIFNGTLNIMRSTFYNNNAVFGYGGGLGTPSLFGGIVKLTNVTLSQNKANWGGGVHLFGGTSNFNYVTFYNNTTVRETSSSVYLANGSTTWKNVIVQTGSGSNCLLSFINITTAGYNLASDSSCNLTGVGDLQNTDAQLGPLKDNGGATFTHLPKLGSPARDSGQCIGSITADQRGVARPQGGTCDRGAVERSADDQDSYFVFLPFTMR